MQEWRKAFGGGTKDGEPEVTNPDEFLNDFRVMIYGPNPLYKYAEYFWAYRKSGTANHYRLWKHDKEDWKDTTDQIQPLAEAPELPEGAVEQLEIFGIPTPVPFDHGGKVKWAFLDSLLPRFWVGDNEMQMGAAGVKNAMVDYVIKALKLGADVRDPELLDLVAKQNLRIVDLRNEGAATLEEGRYWKGGVIHNAELMERTLDYPSFPPPKWQSGGVNSKLSGSFRSRHPLNIA